MHDLRSSDRLLLRQGQGALPDLPRLRPGVQHPLPSRNSMMAWADRESASGAYRDYVESRPMRSATSRIVLRPSAIESSPDGCSTWAVRADNSRSRGVARLRRSGRGVLVERNRCCQGGHPLPNLRGQPGDPARRWGVRRGERLRHHRARARSTSVSASVRPPAEARRAVAHQHAGHGACAPLFHAVCWPMLSHAASLCSRDAARQRSRRRASTVSMCGPATRPSAPNT